jgi:hypothetical protein
VLALLPAAGIAVAMAVVAPERADPSSGLEVAQATAVATQRNQ